MDTIHRIAKEKLICEGDSVEKELAAEMGDNESVSQNGRRLCDEF